MKDLTLTTTEVTLIRRCQDVRLNVHSKHEWLNPLKNLQQRGYLKLLLEDDGSHTVQLTRKGEDLDLSKPATPEEPMSNNIYPIRQMSVAAVSDGTCYCSSVWGGTYPIIELLAAYKQEGRWWLVYREGTTPLVGQPATKVNFTVLGGPGNYELPEGSRLLGTHQWVSGLELFFAAIEQ